MSVSLFIASHLPLKSTRRDSSTGLIIAIAGIALSVTVMLISIAVMSGFRSEIRQKVIGFDSQLTIGLTPEPDSPILLSKADISPLLEVLPSNVTYTLTGRQPAILKTPDNFSGSVIKGVDKNYDWSFIKSNLVEGTVPDYRSDSTEYHIVVSRTLARALSLELGQKTDAYFLGDGAYRIRRLKIAGIYDTHFSEYDRNMIFGSLSMLQRVADIPDSCATMIEINGLQDDDAIDN
ncbi:MAG: ABC transporter permease, partial [Duncaniella sp.]|nr:ABC transporter permease [Duncaniella sp.]